MKTSSFNPEYVEELMNRMAIAKAQEERDLGIGPNLPGWEPVLERNRQKTLAENTYRGISKTDTEITQRLAAASEKPAMSWDEKGKEIQAYGDQLKKADAKRQEALQKGWKSRDEEMEDIAQRLSNL